VLHHVVDHPAFLDHARRRVAPLSCASRSPRTPTGLKIRRPQGRKGRGDQKKKSLDPRVPCALAVSIRLLL
jgi:hypothetical protein